MPDQTVIKSKIVKSRSIITQIDKEMDHQRQLYSNCYKAKGEGLKKNATQQAIWHQEALNDLFVQKEEVEGFLLNLNDTQEKMNAAFQQAQS